MQNYCTKCEFTFNWPDEKFICLICQDEYCGCCVIDIATRKAPIFSDNPLVVCDDCDINTEDAIEL